MAKLKTNNGYEFEVDDEDVNAVLKEGGWYGYPNKYTYYIKKSIRIKNKIYQIKLHRWLLGLENNPEILVDHRDFNGLNNRINNLRPCSKYQSIRNRNKFKSKTKKYSSKYKGATYIRNKYRAQIVYNKKIYYLGTFSAEEDAAIAYDIAAKYLFGTFAKLNILL